MAGVAGVVSTAYFIVAVSHQSCQSLSVLSLKYAKRRLVAVQSIACFTGGCSRTSRSPHIVTGFIFPPEMSHGADTLANYPRPLSEGYFDDEHGSNRGQTGTNQGIA